MSFFISDYEIDKIIEEDINPFDLTSHILNMKNAEAEITYEGRSDLVLCCTEEVDRIYKKCGLEVDFFMESGTAVKEGEVFFKARGRGDNLHLAWRNGLRVFESFCGVSTRTASFVKNAREVNPGINIVTTRKNIPGTKKLVIKAVVSGGAFPHRLGLSETVLLFDGHIDLYGGKEKIIEDLPVMRSQAAEKRIGIEAKDMESALQFIEAGFDFIQLDKFPIPEIKEIYRRAKEAPHEIIVAAAGSIKQDNVKEYAATGVDVLVTSALYFGPPADIKARITTL
jgi:molybdenum transport protein